MALRHLTHLAEPQSAAGVPVLVSDDRADQPRLAGMDALLRQITFESINLSFSIVPGCSQCSCGLLPDRFILQDERRLWRRMEP